MFVFAGDGELDPLIMNERGRSDDDEEDDSFAEEPTTEVRIFPLDDFRRQRR